MAEQTKQQKNTDLEEIVKISPFKLEDIKGELFAKGNLLGGASPLESATDAPWKNR